MQFHPKAEYLSKIALISGNASPIQTKIAGSTGVKAKSVVNDMLLLCCCPSYISSFDSLGDFHSTEISDSYSAGRLGCEK